MIQIPKLTSKNDTNSSFSSTQLQKNGEGQFLMESIVDSDEIQQNSEDQIIMQIQNNNEDAIIRYNQSKQAEKQPKAKKWQNNSENYQRFKITQRNFMLQSDEDSQEPPQDKKISLKLGKLNQNIFFTQILQSRVFHRDVIEAAKSQAEMKDSLATTKQIATNTHKNKQEQRQVMQPTVLFSTDINLLMGNEWINDRIMVKIQELRFNEFYTQVKGLSKIKVFRESPHEQFIKIKLTINNSDYIIGVKVEKGQIQHAYAKQFRLFSNIIKGKMTMMGNKMDAQLLTTGKLLKKSQFLANWQERYVKVENDEFYSHKQLNSKCSFKIKRGSIKEIWTRFDLYRGLLIIKIMHSLKKTQIGIPLTDLTSMSNENWLWIFFNMLKAN